MPFVLVYKLLSTKNKYSRPFWISEQPDAILCWKIRLLIIHYGSKYGSGWFLWGLRKISLNFLSLKVKKKSWNRTISGLFMVAEAGLEPTTSGLWAAKSPIFLGVSRVFPVFYGKPGGHKSNKICPIHCVIIPYGSKHGSAMCSCYGPAKQTAFTTEFGLAAHS